MFQLTNQHVKLRNDLIMKKLRIPFTIVSIILLLLACEDPWDKHLNEFSLDTATENLLEIIQNTPELSDFAQLITDAGAASYFTASQVSTVWAPTNTALGSISAEITNDPEKQLQFILNHIAKGLYPQLASQEEIRCKMINGKRILMNMAEPTIYGASVTGQFNQAATNGVLHVIDNSIELRASIWEYIESQEAGNNQLDFLNSITGELFVDSLATIIDYDPVTSKPIYDTLSGTIWYNQYVFENADLRNEDSTFTFLILENDVYNDQLNRFTPYYILKNTDSLVALEFYNYKVAEDMTSSGIWTPEELPGTIKSVNGISVPFTSGAVVETIEASNGIIYRLSNCDLSLEAKFPPVYIEGETMDKVIFTGGGSDGYTRIKPLARGGLDFVLDDHDGNPGKIIYHIGNLAATKYEFYWLAVDDFGGSYYGAVPDSLIRQKLEKVIYNPSAPIENRYPMHKTISDSLLYVVDLSYETAELRYAGSYTLDNYEDFWLHLVGSGSNTTMTLDYLKIVPVFE